MAIGTPNGSEYDPTTGDVAERDCGVPAGTSDGDVLVAYAVLSQDDAAATGIVCSGWTPYPFAQATGTGRTAVLIRQWQTGDPTNFTFTKTGSASSGTFAVVMDRVPGGDPTPVVAPVATDQAASSTAVTCPAVTVPGGLASNAAVVRFYHTYYYLAAKNNTDTWTPPSGFTELADQSDDWCSIGSAVLLRGAGSQASAAATAGDSTGGAFGRGVSLVIAPAAAAGPEPGRRLLLAA